MVGFVRQNCRKGKGGGGVSRWKRCLAPRGAERIKVKIRLGVCGTLPANENFERTGYCTIYKKSFGEFQPKSSCVFVFGCQTVEVCESRQGCGNFNKIFIFGKEIIQKGCSLVLGENPDFVIQQAGSAYGAKG